MWFPYKTERNSSCRCKLFCFHHAGGSSLAFRDWIHLDSSIEVIPVELPGRGRRIREECRTDLAALMDEIGNEVIKEAKYDRVFLYGHSLGALLAFKLETVLENTYGKTAEGLFLSGRHAPGDQDPSPYTTDMGMQALKEELLRLGNTPGELLEDKSFLEYCMPIVFADYRLAEDFSGEEEKVNCPVCAMCGNTDDLAYAETVKNWCRITDKQFVFKEFQGGHFFVYKESPDEVKQCIMHLMKNDFRP